MGIAKAKKISLFVLFSAGTFFVLFMLHEIGHAITAALYGAEITGISFDHVTWGNAPFTARQLSWIYLNGTLLPAIVSIPFFGHKSGHHYITGAISFGAIAGGWFEVYSWTMAAFILPAESDMAWFLEFSGAEIMPIRIISVAICLAYSVLAIWKCAIILVSNFSDTN